MVGKKSELGDGLSWTLIRHTPNISEKDKGCSKLKEKVLGNSKIALAWMLMNESFMSIIDRLTGADLLRTVVYNNRYIGTIGRKHRKKKLKNDFPLTFMLCYMTVRNLGGSISRVFIPSFWRRAMKWSPLHLSGNKYYFFLPSL